MSEIIFMKQRWSEWGFYIARGRETLFASSRADGYRLDLNGFYKLGNIVLFWTRQQCLGGPLKLLGGLNPLHLRSAYAPAAGDRDRTRENFVYVDIGRHCYRFYGVGRSGGRNDTGKTSRQRAFKITFPIQRN